MKKAIITKGFVLALAGIFMTSTMLAQNEKSKRPSPPAIATGTVHGATITINYSSPSVKGRKIWGDLVPYDNGWRAGANEATILGTNTDIKVDGKTLGAGKHRLHAIQGEKGWTVICN